MNLNKYLNKKFVIHCKICWFWDFHWPERLLSVVVKRKKTTTNTAVHPNQKNYQMFGIRQKKKSFGLFFLNTHELLVYKIKNKIFILRLINLNVWCVCRHSQELDELQNANTSLQSQLDNTSQLLQQKASELDQQKKQVPEL